MFFNKKTIDLSLVNPSSDNIEAYYKQTISLYNCAEYEEALMGLEKLSSFKGESRILLIPHIEKCKHIKSIVPHESDLVHRENQKFLKKFNWIDKSKYFTGFGALGFFGLLWGDFEGGENIFDILPSHPEYLVLMLFCATAAFLTHKFTSKYVISEGLFRCKYCGRYTEFVDPNKPTYGFLDNNRCRHCHRMYPVPDFYWDSWEGLEYMEKRTSVPEGIFYEELKVFKSRYYDEYLEWKRKKNESAT